MSPHIGGDGYLRDEASNRWEHLRGDPRAMAMTTAALSRLGKHSDAVSLGLAATQDALHGTEAANVVRWALSQGVPRFHHAMLNDAARNRAYLEAIARDVKPGMKVLEIGAGSGLLAMAAARAGATVTTCEAVPAVAAVAAEIIARNGYADRVRVIPKMASKVHLGVDLAEPADVVIHEIFGEYLFNEGVDGALKDARERLLKPGATSIPPRAGIRFALATVDAPPRHDIGTVEGFDLSPFNLLIHPCQKWFPAKHGWTRVSKPYSGLSMDYARPAHPFGPTRETVTVESQGGQVDAVLQWLRVDFGGGLFVESDPAGPEPSSWAAALYSLERPIQTKAGDLFDVSLLHDGMNLSIEARPR